MTLERDILNKLRSIEERLEKIEKQHRKKNLPWKAAVPPKALCRDIITGFDGGQFGSFEYMMQRLSEFYGIPVMDNRTDAGKVPAKAIACYHSNDRTAYYKKLICSKDVVLHEFFHHLHAESVVWLEADENEEECADEFAKIIIYRGTELP